MANIKKVAVKAMPLWTYLVPVMGLIIFFLHFYISWGPFLSVMVIALIGSVLAAVQHAETVAHRVGEPIGSVILAIAVTVIEVSLIIALMFSSQTIDSALARDTVFATVMIILNGMVGLCILTGGIKYGEQSFGLQGISSTLTILVAISILTLIFPNFTTSAPGPFYSRAQLIFVAIVTFILYVTFTLVQNYRHRAHFLEPYEIEEEKSVKPGKGIALASVIFLLICLAAVVELAESMAHPLENWIEHVGAPHSLVGVIIAAVVLLPEGIAAYQAARSNRLQKSLNLSLGSALASIGLSIPTISIVAVLTNTPITLGIDSTSMVLFLLTVLVIMLSLSTGKTTILQGTVLLIIFFVYLFFKVSP